MLYKLKLPVFIYYLICSTVLHSQDLNKVTIGLRLPLGSFQARDFLVPRIGVEIGVKSAIPLMSSVEFGVPVRSTVENTPAKGFFIAAQSMVLIGQKLHSYLGLRASYIKADIKDYMRYDESMSLFEFSQYKQTDIGKSKFKIGLLTVQREKVYNRLYAELQVEIGYTNNQIIVNDDVDQVYFNNGWFANSKKYEGPYLNLGINLLYSVL
jgi:hypothetical protein